MKRFLLFSLLVCACAGVGAQTLGVTPAVWMKSTGAPSATCSATVNNGIFDVSEALHIYQCSNNNVGATYVWNDLGGAGGCSGVTPGSYTSANITVNSAGCVTAAANGTGSVQWQRQPSPVIFPYPSDLSPQMQEMSAVLDNSPEILTGLNKVVKMTWTDGLWPTSGGGTGVGVCFGESPDGITPVTRSSPCPIASTVNHGRSWLMDNPVGGGYILYAATIPGTQMDQFTGSTVAGLTLAHSNVLACGSNGNEASGQTYNMAVWYDTTQTPHWRMLYECENSATSTYSLWLATSSDGVSWSKYQTAPVIGGGSSVTMGGACNGSSGAWVGLEGGIPHAYIHCTPSGQAPSPYIWHLKDSTGVGATWVPDASPAITARTGGEGVYNSNGQIADAFALDMGSLNESLLFWSEYGLGCTSPPTCSNPSFIEVAQINQPLATVVNEGATDGPATQTVPALLVNGVPPANNQLLNLITGYVPTPSSKTSSGAAGQWSVGPGPSGYGEFYAYDSTTALWMQIQGSETWSTSCPGGYQEYSTFAGTNGTALSSYTSLCGNTFTLYANSGVTATIPELSGSNTAVLASGSYAATLSTLTPSSANYKVSATFALTSSAVSTDQALVFARASSGSNTSYAFACAPYSGVCGLYGPSGQIGSNYTFTWGALGSHVLSLQVSGTSITCSIDGSSVISQTDSSISAAGLAGFRITPNLSGAVFTVQ